MGEDSKVTDGMEVVFWPHGVTSTTVGNEQVTYLQKPWIEMFFEYLESKGVEPEKQHYVLPNGKRAEPYRTSEGWNWKIID